MNRTETPDEIMRVAHRQIETSLAQDLLDRILAAPPGFFERLIVNLLLSMGFGGSAAVEPGSVPALGIQFNSIGRVGNHHRWLAVTEQLFAIAEIPEDPLGILLRTPTQYRGRRDVQMKIFLMERVATWILITDRSLVARARDPFVARSRIYKLPLAIICDALKIAYTTQGRSQYKDVFLMLRRFARPWTLQVRLSGALRVGGARPYLRLLKSYWDKKAG